MSDDGAKRGPGRPPGPTNQREKAARRANAVKHGGRAQTALRRAVPPCKRKTCVADYPCAVKTGVEGRGGGMEVCLPRLAVDPEIVARYRRALETGDSEPTQTLVADALATMATLHREEGRRLLEDGLSLDQVVLVRDDKGNLLKDEAGEPLTRPVLNPSAAPWLRLSELLGFTGRDQAVTPASQTQAARDRGLSSLADFMARATRGLGETDEP